MEKVYKRINWENKPSKNTAVNEDNLNRMDYSVDVIDTRVCELAGYEERAAESASASKVSENKAAVSEGKAKTSETNAKNSETKAGEYAMSSEKSAVLSQSYTVGGTGTRAGENTDNAKYYKEQAQALQSKAALSATDAASSVKKASTSENNAKVSENNAKTSETHAKTSEANAQSSAVNASASSDTSAAGAKAAESYAVGGTGTRAGENTDNAKYYKEQAERIAEGLKGSLIPMGTILFAGLPDKSTSGYMYNISNEFITTSRFKEGAGNIVPAGTNVYYTADGYWDCLAGSPVTGIKGNAESSYRRGNVNLTKANIGLGNVPNVSTNDQTPTYTESTTLTNLISGEKLSISFGKIKKAITSLINHVSLMATTSIAGHVKLTNSVSSTSITTAATPANVKTAYDKAVAALPKADVTRSATVTAAGTYALDAVEKNASVSGTLSNQIALLNNNLAAKNTLTMLFDAGLFAQKVGDSVTYIITQDISSYKEILFLCNMGDFFKIIRVPIALSGVHLGESYYVSDGYKGALDLVFTWQTKKVEIYLRMCNGFAVTNFGISQIFGIK